MQKQFPLDSLIDNGTCDIIQSEPQWKKKNSLLYKGILSNMTRQNGGGILSTTGKQITTGSNTVYVDGRSISVSPKATVHSGGSMDFGDALLCSRFFPNGSSYYGYVILKHSGQSLEIRRYNIDSSGNWSQVGSSAYLNDNGVVDFQAGITSTQNIYVVAYYSNSYYDYCYRYNWNGSGFSNIHLFSSNSFNGSTPYTAFGETLYVGHSSVDGREYLGFDSVDMRKRLTVGINGNSVDRSVYGLGCIDDNATIITGEPVLQFMNRGSLTNWGNELSRTTGGYFTSFSYYQGNFGAGSFGVSPQTTSSGKIVHNMIGDIDSVPYFPDTTNPATITTPVGDVSYRTCLKDMWSTPNDNSTQDFCIYHGDSNTEHQKKAPLYYWKSNSSYSTAQSSIFWVFAISIESSGLRSLGTADAYAPTYYKGEEGGIDKILNHMSTYFGYWDYDNPLGAIGQAASNSTSYGEDQVFPHIKFIENDSLRKGQSWDYGPGWFRGIYGSHTVITACRMSGTTVVEHPLKYIEIYGATGSYNECTTRVSDLDLGSKLVGGYAVTNENWVDCEKFAKDWESLDHDDTYILPPTDYFFQFNLVQWNMGGAGFYINGSFDYVSIRGRCHPITDTQLQSSSWYWNHNFTGIRENSMLKSIPFSVPIGGYSNLGYNALYYDNNCVALAVNQTLLTTPHDLGHNYYVSRSGNYDVVTTFTKGTVEVNGLRQNAALGSITVSKMADYIFKLNIIADNDVLVEDRDGNITIQKAFIPYIMNTTFDSLSTVDLKYPGDSTSYLSNDVFYFGFGANSGLKEDAVSSSFLLPAITINGYVSSDDTEKFSSRFLSDRYSPLRADVSVLGPLNMYIQEYWTHSQYSTDVTYKASKRRVGGSYAEGLEDIYVDTSWIPTEDLILYPIGITSRTFGENYITSTVDTGDNYVSRFYNKDNKTFLVFNQNDQVYYGSEIFTIMSGNYYFDGQGIYYLGSQTDYSQNVFTAYAIGMKFLANSSSEAYFYAPWDKSIYIYTASNTLQKGFSLADRGNIIDALYSPAEQSLYILFDDNTLYIKTQQDDCLIEGVNGTQLQSTQDGAFVITSSGYSIYNPYKWGTKVPLSLETEWLGDTIGVQKTSFVDVVLYRDTAKAIDISITVAMIQNGKVVEETQTKHVKKEDWKNQLARVRFVPNKENLVGNAVKVKISGSDISVFNINLEMDTVSQTPAATRSLRL